MPDIQDITHWVGDSRIIKIPVRDGSNGTGNAVNLAGATARWWMAKSVSATGADIYIQKSTGAGISIDHDTSGLYTITITLNPTDTEGKTPGKFYHECEVVDASGNISTTTIGKFILNPTLIPDVL